MLSALTMAVALSTAPAAAADEAPSWDWGKEHRYYLETEVRLPLLMWWFKQFNQQARISAFQTRLVTTCRPGVEKKRRAEVNCTVEDVSLSAAGLPQEEGLLQPILQELDDRLTGSVVQLQVRDDGRLANIQLDGLDRRYQRTGRMNENLRLVVLRAFAGFDLPLPEVYEGEVDGQWVQTDSWILRAPVASGNLGTAQLIHEASDWDQRIVEIDTEGRGIIVPSGGANRYDVVMAGHTRFDQEAGRIMDRDWSMVGVPTPGSAIAEGTAGYPYLQVGRIVQLSGEQTMEVGESEALGPIDGPSALQQWTVLGLMP